MHLIYRGLGEITSKSWEAEKICAQEIYPGGLKKSRKSWKAEKFRAFSNGKQLNKITYYRFCCRIRIAGEDAEEVPGGEYVAIEVGDLRERQEQFASTRVSEDSDWFESTPPLLALVEAIKTGRNPDIRTRLIDTQAACLYSGLTRGALYQLAGRGQLTKYKTRRGSRERVLWDPLEINIVIHVT